MSDQEENATIIVLRTCDAKKVKVSNLSLILFLKSPE